MLLTTTILASLCLPQSGGPLVGIPHTISVSPGTTGGGAPLGHAEVWVKAAGVVSTAPAPLPGGPTGNPDFRISAIMPGLTAYPDIDATSIGFDMILSDNQGRMIVPPLGWGMLTFSVSRSSVGIAGGAVNMESAGDGAWSDIFSYVLPGSAGAAREVGVTRRAQNANEIAVGQTAGNIDAHDVFTAGYALAPSLFASLRSNPTFYFSVTRATLGLVPLSWWSGTAPSGATVLATQWDSSNGTWSVPFPYALYSELGLLVNEDLDALAVDETIDHILFSTTSAARDELLVAIPNASAAWNVYPYIGQNGKTVPKKMGLLKADNVDGICSLDPGSPGGGTFLQMAFGTPLAQALIPGLPHQTSASAYRSYDPALRQDYIHTTLIGWPGPDPRRAVTSVTILAVSVPPFPHLFIVQTFIRDAASSKFLGGPVECKVPIPAPLTGSFQEFQLNWITGEVLNTRNLDLPMPLVIRL